MAGLPLDDLRVLDLTVARAGPTCVRQLADWGADVVRVEAPPRRAAGEGRGGGGGGSEQVGGERDSPDFQNLHRNKRSLTLDLKSEEGRSVFYRLAAGADVAACRKAAAA